MIMEAHCTSNCHKYDTLPTGEIVNTKLGENHKRNKAVQRAISNVDTFVNYPKKSSCYNLFKINNDLTTKNHLQQCGMDFMKETHFKSQFNLKFSYDQEKILKFNFPDIVCNPFNATLVSIYTACLAWRNGIYNCVCLGAPGSEFAVIRFLFPEMIFHIFPERNNKYRRWDNRIKKINGRMTPNVKMYDKPVDYYICDLKKKCGSFLPARALSNSKTFTNVALICNIRTKRGDRIGNGMRSYHKRQDIIVDILRPIISATRFNTMYESGITRGRSGVIFPSVYMESTKTISSVISWWYDKLILIDNDVYNDLMWNINNLRAYENLDNYILHMIFNLYQNCGGVYNQHKFANALKMVLKS